MRSWIRKAFAQLAVLLLAFSLALTGAQAAEREEKKTKHPLLNDLKCLALSPYYVPRNIGATWWGWQVESASFFSPSMRLKGGRKPNVAEKIGFATVVMPVAAVGAVPVATVTRGVIPLTGHVADLFTAPFGKPLGFLRLDNSRV
jgi:hypothetical protein